MVEDPYVYSTYSLVSAIVLYFLKRLHQSQCVLRNGTLQIKLSGLQNSFRAQSQHPHQPADFKSNENQEDTQTTVDSPSSISDIELGLGGNQGDTARAEHKQKGKVRGSKDKHERGGHRLALPTTTAA